MLERWDTKLDVVGRNSAEDLPAKGLELPVSSLAINTSDDQKINEGIFSSLTYACLNDDEQFEINRVVDEFLKTGVMPEFTDTAVKVMFEKQSSSRKEVLRSGGDFLSELIDDDLMLEENQHKLDAIYSEQRFFLYHSLARMQAVTNHTDTIKSQYTEQVKSYHYIRQCTKLLLKGQMNALEKECADRLSKSSELNSHIDNNTQIENLKSQQDLCALQLRERDPQRDKDPRSNDSYLRSFFDIEDSQQWDDYFIYQLRRANARRLCWLWDRIVIELFVACAQSILLTTTLIAEQVSWSLYLFLASIHLAGLAQHSFDFWVNEKERVIEAKKRRRAHFLLRMDVILNDLIWGFANLACCFWLYGLGVYGFIGDVLTAVLLGMDLTVCYIQYADEKQDYEDNISTYDKQLGELFDKIEELHQNKKLKLKLMALKLAITTNSEDSVDGFLASDENSTPQKLAKINMLLEDNKSSLGDENYKKICTLLWQIQITSQRKEGRQSAWNEDRFVCIADVVYSVSLILAFSVLCGFYLTMLPVSLPSSMVMIGAVALGASTLIWRSVKSTRDCYNANKQQIESNDSFKSLVEEYKSLGSSSSDSAKKQLYLKILQKGAQVGLEQDLYLYKKMDFARETFNRIVIPASIAVTLLFAPAALSGVPTFLILMVGVLAIAMASSMIIQKFYKPKDTEWQVEKEGQATKTQPLVIDSEYSIFQKVVKTLSSDDLLDKIKEGRTGNNADLFQRYSTEY
ncbi:MAG: hypothetical protein P1U74_03740 [Legionellaceae bacterium]|nr:hypothetical protein [Legionellaceae bacterium]